MIVFPNCKINLGLRILRKRTDGYHDLETVFYPIPLFDALEIVEYKDPVRSSSMPFTLSGLEVEGDPMSNICAKAYRLLKRDFPQLPHIHMHLHKVIPSGAGLGGGSADAAFTLLLLNRLFQLSLSEKDLIGYAAELGSDCPFFIINKPCVATGRGELLEPVKLDLAGYDIVLVNPGIHVNTGDAFRNLIPAKAPVSVRDIIRQPLERWKDELVNDFEKVIFRKHREIVEIKDTLYRLGALYASMSGSGSTVFGIFPSGNVPALHFPPDYFVRSFGVGQL